MFCLSETWSSERANLRDLKWDNRLACALGFFCPCEDLPKLGQGFKSLQRAVGFVFGAWLLMLHPGGAWAAGPGLGWQVWTLWRRHGVGRALSNVAPYPALDLAAVRNKSKNISSCLFPVLLQWAIREQGFGGEELDAKSLKVARGAVFRSMCDCCLVFWESSVIYVRLLALNTMNIVLRLHCSFHWLQNPRVAGKSASEATQRFGFPSAKSD